MTRLIRYAAFTRLICVLLVICSALHLALQFSPRLAKSGGQKSKSEAGRLGFRQRITSQSRPAQRGLIDVGGAKQRGRGGGEAARDLVPWTAKIPRQNATADCAGRAASKEGPPLISVLTSTTSSRSKFWRNLLRNFDHQTYPNKELIILDDGGSLDRGFWGNISDPRVRHIYRHGHQRLGVGRKHTEMTRLACGDFMAIFDDDDYYGPDYLRFMLGELIERNVSVIKLGSWPQFVGRWEGAQLTGSLWQLDVSKTAARMGYGFTYFFSRAAGLAPVRIQEPDKFDWDSQWIGKLQAAGYGVAVTNTHPSLLVIKIQHGDNLSRPFSRLLRPLHPKASQVQALLHPTLPVKILPHPSNNVGRRARHRPRVFRTPLSR